MKCFFKKSALIFLSGLLSIVAVNVSYAAETVCNDNGGAGWPIVDFGITNLTIPFAFGDVSEIFDIDIQTNIAHTYTGDLTVRATSPQGTTVTMFERPNTTDPEFSTPSGDFGCDRDDILVTFDDESPNPPLENSRCRGGAPVFSGTHQPHESAPDNLAAFDTEDPNGDWDFYLSDSANEDTGTLNQICLTAAFASVTFDKWVSTNNTCSDTLDVLTVAPGIDVYFCYTVSNPSTETFNILPGDAIDNQGHDITTLETSYLQGTSQIVVVGPVVAGSAALPNDTTTINNAQVTATFATANYSGTLVTAETASLIVLDPIFSTSTKDVLDVNGGAADVGDVLRYTITVNETAGAVTNGVSITDIVDPNLDTITIVSIPTGAISNIAGNTITVSGIDVAANGSATVVFEGTIKAGTPAGTDIDNTATINHAASGVSYDAIAATIKTLSPVITTSTKTVVDDNGGLLLAGDLVRYTITIIETGGFPLTDVSVTDVLDVNLTSLNIISQPGTDNSTTSTVVIDNISIAANGSATIVFEANVKGSVAVGTSINNTANIIDSTSGLSSSPVAPTLIVSSVPITGNKLLYLDLLNTLPELTRTVTTTNTDSQEIGGNNGIFTVVQSLPFQAPFAITAGAVDVQLNLQSAGNNTDRARTVVVDLVHVSGGVPTLINTSTAVTYTNNGGTVYRTFTVNLAADEVFAANDSLRIDVRNITTQQNRSVIIRSLIAGNISKVSLQSSTVINLDSVGIYANPYPDTTQFMSYVQGNTVYLRTTVSDPFGSADINSVDFVVTNPATVLSTNVNTASAIPTGSTGVFETAFLIPDGPDGDWTVNYTANEGTETTVFHSTSTAMTVGAPILTVSKNSATISDPVNLTFPKSIPNSIVEYTVESINSGKGFIDTDTVIITDEINSNLTLYFGSPVDPVQFIDGSVASGLTFTFSGLANTSDDVSFSNNGGSTFITPSVDGSGFDITTPPINYIRINPKGSMRGSDGVNDPSFSIKFKVKVN
jgi:uncharacterized repeat protein (TIGR01451 family)